MKLKLIPNWHIDRYVQVELRLFIETSKVMRSFPLFGFWYNRKGKCAAFILFGINFTIQSYW